MQSGTSATAPINQTPIIEQRLVAPVFGTGSWTVRTFQVPSQNPYQPTDSDRAKFSYLVGQWRKDTLLSSSVTQDHMHSAHLGILAMGKPALPLILKDLEQHGGNWFLALRLISDEDPVKPKHAGRVKLMREDWIEWGRQHGYL